MDALNAMHEGDNSPSRPSFEAAAVARPFVIRENRRSDQKASAGRVAVPPSERAYYRVQNLLIFPGQYLRVAPKIYVSTLFRRKYLPPHQY
ncbi:hypothetical protein IE4771_PE00410 (plasmid) [Rhizobium etli bv. mimosae str. IE4771]|uniref:Uncharacterized protein n=1 Tax=Rhizobium etli bv. mimosae str. IE4771 TaxID=1432050 RepID=A0A060IDE8_RHIET|nr:hypothetical protein IE4771_PE00410 [Rhizobium sp. IE4771]